jgi:hypothetical protein
MALRAPSSSSAAGSEQPETKEAADSPFVVSFSSSSPPFADPAPVIGAPASASTSAIHPVDDLMSEVTVQFDLLYSAIKQHDANDEKYSQSLHSNVTLPVRMLAVSSCSCCSCDACSTALCSVCSGERGE